MHPVIILRLVIVDSPAAIGVPPTVHPHNYVYLGVERLEQTLRTVTTEHDKAFVYDGTGAKVAHCYAGMPPWIENFV